jgi:hypothetical protein
VTDAADDAYARAALDGECAELAHAGASRNEQLNKAAFALGQFVGADRLTHGEVESALFDAAVANGDVPKDGPAAARARIKSGIENGSLEPRLNGAEPRRSEALPRNRHAAALPVAYGGALPPWTPPDEKGWPRFEAIGEGEPPSLQDEIPGRRHLYRRNGQPVRMKIKRRGGGFVADDPVFVPEGEKDVDTLTAHGLAAFSFGGSSDRPDGCERWVARRDIVILADNDKQGRRHARKLAAAFVAVASSVN